MRAASPVTSSISRSVIRVARGVDPAILECRYFENINPQAGHTSAGLLSFAARSCPHLGHFLNVNATRMCELERQTSLRSAGKRRRDWPCTRFCRAHEWMDVLGRVGGAVHSCWLILAGKS